MKNLIPLIAAITLGACTASPEMIAAQRDRCTAVGWQPGTPDHAACVERGTAQQQDAQNAAAVAGGSVLGGIAIGELFY